MMNTVVMTKGEVSKVGESLYSITIRTVVNDGAADIFDEIFSVKYNSNAQDMEAMKADYLQQVKNAWDKQQAENDIYVAAQFDNAVADMQADAQVYVNP